MNIKINKIDEINCIEINGVEIPSVSDFEVKSSASGDTELTIKISGKISVFELSASSAEPKQLNQ